MGYGLLILVVFDTIALFVNPDLSNTNWQRTTYRQAVETSAVPLIALLFIYYAGTYARAPWERWVGIVTSWGALVWGLAMIALIFPHFRNMTKVENELTSNISQQIDQQMKAANQFATSLESATDEQVLAFLERGGQTPEGKQPEEIRAQLLETLNQGKSQAASQLKADNEARIKAIRKETMKTGAAAVVTGALFILLFRHGRWARESFKKRP